MMHLMIGKLPLLGYEGGGLGCRHPTADTFALLAGQLAGARAVTRAETGDRPALHVLEVDRAVRGPLLVLWDHRDAFHGEDEPPVTVTWPWPAATATVTDVFGQTRTVRGKDGRIRLPVSGTPVFVAERHSPAGPGVRGEPGRAGHDHRPGRRSGAGRAGSAERRHRGREPAGGEPVDLAGLADDLDCADPEPGRRAAHR